MNKVILIGRLTKDPEMRYTPSNVPVTTFSIAVDRPYTNQNGEKEADFINILVWRKQAENCSKYLYKGSLIAIEGNIQTRNYEGQDGKKVYVTEVVADNVQFLSTKKEKSGTQSGAESGTQENNPYKDMSVKVEADQSIEISDSDLPF